MSGVAHHKPRRSPAQRVALRGAVLAEIERVARAGEICPYGEAMGRRVGCSATMISNILRDLKAEGVIDFGSRFCGTGVGKVRIVRFLASGLTTATPTFGTRTTGYVPPSTDPDALKTAKIILQRRGCIVYAASISDGSKGKGLIRVDRERLPPAEVIARAAIVGRPS